MESSDPPPGSLAVTVLAQGGDPLEPPVAALAQGGDPPSVTAPAQAPSPEAVAVDGRSWSLSPSRAADFLTCPLLYRFRVLDRLPEARSPAMARGTLVHAVLERLFDVPAADRTPETAAGLLEPEWQRLSEAEPELAGLFADEAERAQWLDQARAMVGRYFTLEDPTRLEPAHRELPVEAVLATGLRLRGYIDRLDVSVAGEVRIVDYKTGTAPRVDFEARALFQMRFYALVLWRTTGTVPRLLQLIYLGNGEIVRYAPDEADLLATERKIEALWRAIERARQAGDWRPRPSKLCDWCAHQALCPAFGGTPPPLPEAGGEPVLADGAVLADGPVLADGAVLADGSEPAGPVPETVLARDRDFEL
ncbi:MAG: RecB family exonuclease [Streptosporangiaceae bacterium]